MGSGYFPLYDKSDDGQKLKGAAALIEDVIEIYYDSVYSGDGGQFDNAASDGGALARLELAKNLCLGEIQ